MTRKERMGASKGFTLIELAVVLAIIAVLAAVMTPIITNYVDQSRVARAQSDVKTIAEAIKAYNRDTGQYPIYDTFSDMLGDTAAKNCLKGPGGVPDQNGHNWTTTCSTLGDLEVFLNSNKLNSGVPTGSTGMPTSATLGKVAFRGPYIERVDSDPWGNRYAVSADNLKRSSTKWAYVISAGPNQKIETDIDITSTTSDGAASTKLTPGGDDIIAVIK